LDFLKLNFKYFNNYIYDVANQKKLKLKKKTKSAPHRRVWWVGWGRSVFRNIFFLQGCKSNRKFYNGENQKWHILQGWKTLLTLI